MTFSQEDEHDAHEQHFYCKHDDDEIFVIQKSMYIFFTWDMQRYINRIFSSFFNLFQNLSYRE